ncbi:DUF2298 domain-containing protein [Halarchaeum sp. P4]|uniref:DUF2298 domain-containing protein n=1 Tax=Halarchaeum sp. P4 TaxID=3421639 RepID=UPI003EB7D243
MEYTLALAWLCFVLVLGFLGLPISAMLFARFPDRGATFALPCSLTLVTIAAYWVGHVRFGFVAAVVAVAALTIVAVTIIARGVTLPFRPYARAATVFTIAFGLLVAVRAVTPGIVPAGGEKFLDYSLIQAVLRAGVLPPEDPWFAGEAVRYYYGGQLRAALLVRLTGVSASIGYNLALATAFGTLVTAAYGLAGALADARGHSARIGGVLGAFFVGFAGNLATPVRALFGLLPADLARQYGHEVFGAIRVPYTEAVSAGSSIDPYTYWYARYVIEGTLTPFPLWAFYNGDLNAYMLATPLLLLVAALCFAYYQTPAEAVGRRRLLVFGAVPVVGSVIGITSTWSVPTTGGLLWLALVFAAADPVTLLPKRVAASLPGDDDGTLRLTHELRRAVVSLAIAAVSLTTALALVSPFYLFHTPINRGLGLLPPRSDLVPLLLVWGVFVALFVGYLYPRLREGVPRRTRRLAAVGYLVLSVALLAADLAAVALFVPLLLGGWILLRRDADVGYEAVLVVAGIGLLLAVEFAYARVYPFNPATPRWNTVYKVSMQIWVLWGVAAGAIAVSLISRLRSSTTDETTFIGRRVLHAGHWKVALVVLLLGSASFGALTLGGHFEGSLDDQHTLDGTAYVETWHPHEADAIAWLDARNGTPTLVSKPGTTTYTWVNAPSSLTGVPTVLGWDHQIGYRGSDAYTDRQHDVQLIFTANETYTVRLLLEKYDVTYIYVGPNERQAYDLRNFSAIPGVEPAYQNQAVTIYRVSSRTYPTANRSRDVYRLR